MTGHIRTRAAVRLLIFAVFIFAAPLSGRAQMEAPSQQGITGAYNPLESIRLASDVIMQRTNLFGDMIPLYPADRHIRRAWQEAARIGDGNLQDYFAVYYIFPQDGKPVVATGILMPAGEDLESIHLASMHFRLDDKVCERVKGLPKSTIVYAVDGTGNKAWWPLEFFAADVEYPGYYSAQGLYAYTYTPSPKLLGRYGNTAFYLDILDPALIERARVIPEDNITVLTGDIPDDIISVAQYSKPVFFNKIIPLLSLYPEYAEIPYEIAFIKPEGKKGSIELRVPAGLAHHHSGDSICIAPAPGMFDALEQYRAFVIAELYSLGKNEMVTELLGYELSVSHFNEAGEVDILKVPDKRGKLEFCPEIFIRPDGDEQFLHVHDFDEGMSQEGVYVFLRDESDPASVELFALLESHLAEPCYGDWPPLNTLPVEDWTVKYDTVKYGIGKLPRPYNIQPKIPNRVYIEPDKLFELDVLPDFYGRGIDGFRQWLHENMEYPPYAVANNLDGFVEFEFVVGSDGIMYNLDILDASHMVFVAELVRVLSSDYTWKPGEISGFPVNVQLRMRMEFIPPGL